MFTLRLKGRDFVVELCARWVVGGGRGVGFQHYDRLLNLWYNPDAVEMELNPLMSLPRSKGTLDLARVVAYLQHLLTCWRWGSSKQRTDNKIEAVVSSSVASSFLLNPSLK